MSTVIGTAVIILIGFAVAVCVVAAFLDWVAR